jgi:predicted nucleic acid-binding protein
LSSLLDTSVLVPVFLVEHPHHAASMRLFQQCSRGSAFCAAHNLVETYSTLTRIPLPHRATPAQADLFLDNVCQRLDSVSLEATEYRDAIRQASIAWIAGGAVYDFLISRCALKVKADALYTWNTQHFSRFGSEFSQIVRIPN